MSEFQREERYIVVKLKNLSHMQERHLRACLHGEGIKTVESVVVEHDWPEYRFVWMMLEHRMSGAPIPDFNTVRTTAELDAERLRADTAVAEVASLREELAGLQSSCAIDRRHLDRMIEHSDDLQQRLAAAEQRNADTIAKLELAASMMDDDERGNRFAEVCRLAIKSLKPTESGLSEPQCLLCLDAKTVPGNILGGFVKDCPDCCGEEG